MRRVHSPPNAPPVDMTQIRKTDTTRQASIACSFHINVAQLCEQNRQKKYRKKMGPDMKVMTGGGQGEGQNERAEHEIHTGTVDSQSQEGIEGRNQRDRQNEESIKTRKAVDKSHETFTEPLLGNPGVSEMAEGINIRAGESAVS